MRQIVIRLQAMRARRAGRHWRLDHEPLAVETPSRFLDIRIATRLYGKRRHGGDTGISKLGEIGLVAVPPQERGRIYHRPSLGFGAVEQRQPARVIEVISPGDQRQHEVVVRYVRHVGPGNRIHRAIRAPERVRLNIERPVP